MRLSLPGLTVETSWRSLRYWLIHLFVDELIFSKHVLWPFSMYEIKSGRREHVPQNHPLVKLYRSIYADEKSGH